MSKIDVYLDDDTMMSYLSTRAYDIERRQSPLIQEEFFEFLFV